jgi:hypothetical protein
MREEADFPRAICGVSAHCGTIAIWVQINLKDTMCHVTIVTFLAGIPLEIWTRSC